MQAGKPKEQYLLLRSLNEVIVSFETSSSNRQQITEGQQDQARISGHLHSFILPCQIGMCMCLSIQQYDLAVREQTCCLMLREISVHGSLPTCKLRTYARHVTMPL